VVKEYQPNVEGVVAFAPICPRRTFGVKRMRFDPWIAIAYVAACLVLLILPVSHAHLPLTDLPNHMARMHIEAHAGNPILSRFYDVKFDLIPNLSLDILNYAFPTGIDREFSTKIIVVSTIILQFIAIYSL
jgi:hypothetical protein